MNYNKTPNYNKISNFITNFLKVVAEFLKYSFWLNKIGGGPDEDICVALDQSSITQLNNQ